MAKTDIPQSPETDEYLMKRTVTESMVKKFRKLTRAFKQIFSPKG